MKNISFFLSENFQRLEVKFSIYFNRRVSIILHRFCGRKGLRVPQNNAVFTFVFRGIVERNFRQTQNLAFKLHQDKEQTNQENPYISLISKTVSEMPDRSHINIQIRQRSGKNTEAPQRHSDILENYVQFKLALGPYTVLRNTLLPMKSLNKIETPIFISLCVPRETFVSFGITEPVVVYLKMEFCSCIR